MATEECLLSEDVQVRNPGLSRQALEEALCEYLGITRVVWLKRGIAAMIPMAHRRPGALR